ncbi:MAG TPA: 3D domain-containing protein [Kofleriaceae bacterium]|nr:3D domain-containing protein [Kofleriaceae bacterium]
MKRFGLRAATAAVTKFSRGRIYALAPAVAILGLAIGASALAPHGPPVEPIEVGAAARALVDRGRPLFTVLPRPEPDKKLGSFKLTYYFMAEQEGGKRAVTLFERKGCKRIAKVSRKDAKQLALQGGGKLEDGRILIYAGRCKCSGAPCYSLADQSHEWGTGIDDRPLSPFRSVAVDPNRVSIGTVLYIPELDGLTVPGRMPEGGHVHDGCVVADDRGGGIKGRQLDLFMAKEIHYRAFQRRNRIKRVTVFRGGERCKSLGQRVAARLGDG